MIHSVEGMQLNKKFRKEFSDITSKARLKDLSAKTINVKNTEKLRKYRLSFIASLSKAR